MWQKSGGGCTGGHLLPNCTFSNISPPLASTVQVTQALQDEDMDKLLLSSHGLKFMKNKDENSIIIYVSNYIYSLSNYEETFDKVFTSEGKLDRISSKTE